MEELRKNSIGSSRWANPNDLDQSPNVSQLNKNVKLYVLMVTLITYFQHERSSKGNQDGCVYHQDQNQPIPDSLWETRFQSELFGMRSNKTGLSNNRDNQFTSRLY